MPLAFVEEANRRGLGVVVVELDCGPSASGRASRTVGSRLRGFGGPIYRLELSRWNEMVELFARHGVEEVYAAGKVSRPDAAAAVEQASAGELREIYREGSHLGDQALSQLFARSLARRGLRLGEQREILGSLLAPGGVLGLRPPTAREQADLELGMRLARQVAQLDIGQVVAVKGGVVLAVEAAAEGTDAAIRRAGRLGGPGVVVAKASRPDQDLRLDTPVVGPGTIRAMAAAGASCLAIEAGRCFVLRREATLAAADRAGISVVAC